MGGVGGGVDGAEGGVGGVGGGGVGGGGANCHKKAKQKANINDNGAVQKGGE